MSSKTPIKLHTRKLSTVKESQQIQQMGKSSLRTWVIGQAERDHNDMLKYLNI